MKTAVKLGRLKLKTPLVCASGTFGFGHQLKGLVDFSCIGAIATKTITLAPRAGNPPPRIYETNCGVINSVGLENPGLDVFLRDILPLAQRLNTELIVSVGGNSFAEYKALVKELGRQKSIAAIEVNLSCPNLRLKKLISQDAKETYRLARILRPLTQKPLIVKITPEVTDIIKIAKGVERAGIDAVALVNTFFSLAIDVDNMRPYLGSIYGGYSGRAIKPMSLYRVWRVAQNLKIPVIGGGGVETAADAIEFILAGAQAVSLGTINMVYPNQACRITAGIKEYMKKKKIKDINLIRSKLDVKKR